MLRILARTRTSDTVWVSDVWDSIRICIFPVVETEGKPEESQCTVCTHGTRCAHAKLVRNVALAVVEARAQSSMGAHP